MYHPPLWEENQSHFYQFVGDLDRAGLWCIFRGWWWCRSERRNGTIFFVEINLLFLGKESGLRNGRHLDCYPLIFIPIHIYSLQLSSSLLPPPPPLTSSSSLQEFPRHSQQPARSTTATSTATARHLRFHVHFEGHFGGVVDDGLFVG